MTPRRRPAGDADERAMLTGWLDYQRATVRLKCDGLSDEDARKAVLPSSPAMTVAGLVSHLRWVEHGWFEVSFLGAPDRSPTSPEDELAQWRAPGVTLADLLDAYDDQCARSREIVANHALDEPEAWAPPGLEVVSLRWIVGHLLEETARHLGHLDAMRELLDGTTGS
ncbi:uncharacterized protein DUF664 [Kribbella amoyensis]|uniref:Uncharacterized protein DUF664 n=1 Tax=Kribbella amoyensis TaxID=996641 RepID=A0A561B3M7_9ACTN|nr:DinB family protein [Kribbella amoyensis]TWD73469.1 uncharacterized protein DUF664 [Kribbella amoyensis]